MSELADRVRTWHRAGQPYALASVVSTSSGARYPAGPAFALDADGRVAGGVTGGCLHGAVYELCAEALLIDGRVRATYADGEADGLLVPSGLTCGEEIMVEARRVDPQCEPDPLAGSEAEAKADRPRLLLFGAVRYTGALVRMGALAGFRVAVCDARPAFISPDRFPEADEVVTQWPDTYLDAAEVDERTAVCVLTHDEKFDVPILLKALRMPLGYVGAIGSRPTCAKRLDRLRAVGLTADELAKLRSPIGLDLGAHTPEEVAVSILAEIIAVLRGGTGLPLTDVDGPIHHQRPWK